MVLSCTVLKTWFVLLRIQQYRGITNVLHKLRWTLCPYQTEDEGTVVDNGGALNSVKYPSGRYT